MHGDQVGAERDLLQRERVRGQGRLRQEGHRRCANKIWIDYMFAYCMSWPSLYSNLLYDRGQDFLDT